LLASAAFAETSVGGVVFGKVNVAEGNTKKNGPDETTEYVKTSGDNARIRVEVSGQNDEGNFGGWIRLGAGTYDGGVGAAAYAWWKPLDLLKLTIGNNGGDGFFGGVDGPTRWGFYQAAGDLKIVDESYLFGRNWVEPIPVGAFYGGFNKFGLVITLTPMDALEVNIGVPYSSSAVDAEDLYLKTEAQVAYTIDGIGKVALSFDGGRGVVNAKKGTQGKPGDWYIKPDGTVTWVTTEAASKDDFDPNGELVKTGLGITPTTGGKSGFEDPSRVLLYFGLTMIENLGIDVGFAYTFPLTTENSIKKSYPIYAGLGASYTMGQLGIKARVQGKFLESEIGDWSGAKKSEKGAVVIFDVLPSYAVSDNLTAYLAAGITYTGVGKYDGKKDQEEVDGKLEDKKATIGWHIDPYLSYSVGPGTFYAGINLSSSGAKTSGKDAAIGKGKTYIDWAIPIGLIYNF